MQKEPRKLTQRRQFVIWLIHELERSGATLPNPPTYKSLRDAVEAQWISRTERPQ